MTFTKTQGNLANQLIDVVKQENNIDELNARLQKSFGIGRFINSELERESFLMFLHKKNLRHSSEIDFGDFQTPSTLAIKVCQTLKDFGVRPQILIEPTCGAGNFVLAALETFPSIQTVYCVELQEHYEWLLKLNLIHFLDSHKRELLKIKFYRDNLFTHDFPNEVKTNKTLILGNPPWVTNAELSGFNSKNLPEKTNFKGFSGLEAMTGKSNFDIAEYMMLKLLGDFAESGATLAMLCKTTVARNIIRDSKNCAFTLSNPISFVFDAKKEFGVSTDAVLFYSQTGGRPAQNKCEVRLLENPRKKLRTFGWAGGSFVSDVEGYENVKRFDKFSSLEWRQGVKHDAVSVFVLEEKDNCLMNGFNEIVNVEADYTFPFVKGSELRNGVLKKSNRSIIITQKKVGEDTSILSKKAPKLWQYLKSKEELLKNRKSRIYKNGVDFSIFGIGEYSFSPYKIAIAGMYKKPHFSLVFPIEEKPVMLDDTTYFIGFNSYSAAVYTWLLLNAQKTQSLLSSLAFINTQRPYTKEILMRVDLKALANETEFVEIEKVLKHLTKDSISINEADFMSYTQEL